MLTLTALNGQEKGREFQLTGDAPELLGRQAPTIQLADAQTSRKHAEVLLENNTWLIRDLDSTNGTWVNGQKITQITELEVGDRIVIGRHQFRVSAIDDLPAPNPQPTPAQPEPLIGDEELGEMGVDLGESLSADLLDDEALDLPEVPESAIDEEPAAPPAAQVPDEAVSQAAEPEDGVIDLDALLDKDADDQPSHDSAALQEPQEPQEDEPPVPSSPAGDQGVIDLDDLLNDGPTTIEDEAAVELPTEDEPAAASEPDTSEPLESQEPDPTPEATTPDQNVDLDLDELLGDERQDESAVTEPEEEVATEDVTEAPDPSAVASIDAVDVDLEPTVDSPDTDGLDSIEDIDAMLEDLGADADGPEAPVADEPDILADAVPPPEETVEDTSEPDLPDADEPADEEPEDDSPDSLIDIDILAAASTAADIPQADADEKPADQTPPTDDAPEGDATPEVEETGTPDTLDTGDSGPLPEESGIFDSADTDAGLADELPDGPEGPLDELPDEEHVAAEESEAIEDASEPELTSDADEQAASPEEADDQDDELSPDLDDEAELQEAERELLLSQEEQSEAVADYKRSKLMTLSMVLLILIVIGGGGWYAVRFFGDSGDNTESSTKAPTAQINQPEPDTDTAAPETPEEAPDETPQPTGRVAIPDIKPPETKTGIVRIPDIPAKELPVNKATEDTPQGDSTETEPAPEVIDNPVADNNETSDLTPADNTQAPDPFQDVEASVFDLPPADEPGPAEAATETADTQTDISSTNRDGVEPVEPEPTNRNTPAIDTATESPGNNATETPANTDTPDTAVTETAEAAGIPDTSEASDAADEPNEAQLNLLAGVIDSQNKPGTGINEEAAFADARRVVYLVDASGSLVDSFPRVLNELGIVIETLQEGEAFTALFFGADGVTEIPPIGLKWADRQNKRDARSWIDPENGNVNAWGRGDLMQALRRATEYGADEIVILSDNLVGRKPSQETVDTLLEDIADITGEQVKKIHVIQFFTRDPQQVLKTIAERFNGSYSLIPAIAEPSAEVTGGLLYP